MKAYFAWIACLAPSKLTQRAGLVDVCVSIRLVSKSGLIYLSTGSSPPLCKALKMGSLTYDSSRTDILNDIQRCSVWEQSSATSVRKSTGHKLVPRRTPGMSVMFLTILLIHSERKTPLNFVAHEIQLFHPTTHSTAKANEIHPESYRKKTSQMTSYLPVSRGTSSYHT